MPFLHDSALSPCATGGPITPPQNHLRRSLLLPRLSYTQLLTIDSSSAPCPSLSQSFSAQEKLVYDYDGVDQYQRYPHQCPHTRHQIYQFAFNARITSIARPKRRF